MGNTDTRIGAGEPRRRCDRLLVVLLLVLIVAVLFFTLGYLLARALL